MIALKCPNCGHETTGSLNDLRNAVPCANCGRTLTNEAVQTDSVTGPAAPTVQAPPPGKVTFDPHDEVGTTTPPSNSNTDPTLAAPSFKPITRFDFLAPAQSPDELGWLAHYKIVRLLGQGGMGVVFEALDTHLQRTVALKVMKPDIAKDEMARKRFLREAQATASVNSDHIVTIHAVAEHQEVPYLAMEYLVGEPLDRWLKRRGRPSLEETLNIGGDIARGLAAAHERGLIHRDIKPSNIWLETASQRAKILDFGLARDQKDSSNLTNTGVILGTPAYMAPEQAEQAQVNARSDLFSLGCVLYELATGQQAFTGASTMAVLMAVATKEPKRVNDIYADIPADLSNLIAHLLAKNPNDRPASAPEVAQALAVIAVAEGIDRRTPASGISKSTYIGARTPAARRRLPRLALGIAAVIMVLAAGIVGWQVFKHRGEKGPAHAAVLGVTDEEILLGMTGPFSGVSKELGREMEIGLNTYFMSVNDQGGVEGRKIKLVPLDDKYEPDLALANMKKLHEERKVFATIGNIGTPTAAVTVPYANRNKIAFLRRLSARQVLRSDPPDRYVFNYRASYDQETAEICKYLLNVRKVKAHEIAVFSQNDSYGDAGFHGVVKMLRPLVKDVKEIVHVRYKRSPETVDVSDAVAEIQRHPEIRAVVMVPTYEPAAAFIHELKSAKRDLIFANVSFVGSEALALRLRSFKGNFAEGVIVTQVVPPIDSGATILLQYKENLEKYFPNEPASFTSLEGYIDAALFVEGLRRAGKNLTTETLIEKLETIRDLDLGTGAKLTFDIGRHQASNRVWGTILDQAGQFQVLELE